MWLFGKRTNIRKAAREEDEDESIYAEELPSFAPEIETGLSEYTEPQIEDSVEELPSFGAFEEEGNLSFDVEQERQAALQEQAPQTVEDQPEEVTQDEEPSFEEEGTNPKELYDQLMSLPYSARNYGLCDEKMLMIHPDGNGGLYFFETFGDYSVGSPDRCRAFVRLKGLKGQFKGTDYATSDFEYVAEKRSWPLCVLAKNNDQYRSAIDQGYKPYKASADGKGMLLAKDISLYSELLFYLGCYQSFLICTSS